MQAGDAPRHHGTLAFFALAAWYSAVYKDRGQS
jgi:hypothetical protein